MLEQLMKGTVSDASQLRQVSEHRGLGEVKMFSSFISVLSEQEACHFLAWVRHENTSQSQEIAASK